MGNMAYHIEPVQPSDAPELAESMMRAFYQDPHWQSLWDGKLLEEIIADCSKRLPHNLVKDPLKRHQKAVDKNSTPVGVVRWLLPEDKAHSWLEAAVSAKDEDTRQQFKQEFDAATDDEKIRGLNMAMMDDLTVAIEEAEEEVRRGGDQFLTLEYLAVHPQHQRRGIGSLLLEQGLSFADEQHLKTIVVAKNPGVGLYERHGFKVEKRVSQERPQYGWDTPYITTVLVRDPN